MKSHLFMAMVVWCWFSGFALAQPNNPYGPYAAKGPPKMELEGKLQAWQGGMMRITNSAGQPMMFSLPQSPNGVRYTVDVDLGVLKRGMFIRIQAPVGPTGQFLEPVNFMTLFTPAKLSSRVTPVERSMNVPGVYPMAQIQPPRPGEMGSPDVRIVGSVLAVEPTAITLQCGRGPMKIEIAENPTIEMIANSLEFAKPGDSVRGSAVVNPSNHQIAATSITITGAKKITAPPPATPVATEGVKLRVKESPKSKLKSAELKEGLGAVEKVEASPESPSVEKPEMKESPESTNKTDAAEKPESSDKPESDEKATGTEDFQR
jgi:hypothetical protein